LGLAVILSVVGGCADDFSLDEAELHPGLVLVKPEGWILSVHPAGGWELLSTHAARVRKIGVHVFPRARLAEAAGTDDPQSAAFAAAVVERYRGWIRDAVAERRSFTQSLVDFFDTYGELRCAELVERELTWQVCTLRRPDPGHPLWYNLYTAVGEDVVLVTAFAARDDDGREELARREQRALLAAVRRRDPN
jgi:hypothetical protein